MKELDLGYVTAEELVVGGYEATKSVLASVVAQILGSDALQAKGIYAQVSNDIDMARAEFILAMRRERETDVEAEVEGTVDPDGFTYDTVIE